MMNEKQRAAQVVKMTQDLNPQPSKSSMTLAGLMTEFLRSHADGPVDTGHGSFVSDFWLKFDGRDYFVTIQEK